MTDLDTTIQHFALSVKVQTRLCHFYLHPLGSTTIETTQNCLWKPPHIYHHMSPMEGENMWPDNTSFHYLSLPPSGSSLYNPVITHRWVNHGPPNNSQFIPQANLSWHPVVPTIVWSSSTPQPHSVFLSSYLSTPRLCDAKYIKIIKYTCRHR